MNVADAAHAVVHDFPGGSESLAPRLDMSAAILRNKVNPTNTTHHLTLREAVRVTQLTGDDRILRAAASECERVVLELPTADDTDASDMAVLELVAAVWAKQGDLGTAIHQAFADGVLTPQEYAGIKNAVHRAQTKLTALLRRIEGMVEQGG